MGENTIIKDFVLPFKILISPLKTFNQIAQKPSAKGLISLFSLILVFIAATIYARATKINLDINGQPTTLAVTSAFSGWFAYDLALTAINILLYWLVFASGLTFISGITRGKKNPWRFLLVGFGYILSVFIIVYLVRAVMYLSLPSIYFEGISSWPPVEKAQIDFVNNLALESWGLLFAYQFGTIFTLVAFVWLVILGAIAVRAFRESSWAKAALVSAAVFLITVFILGLP